MALFPGNSELHIQKRLGQVVTPRPIIQRILNECHFAFTQDKPLAILDPACGDGRFLSELVLGILKNFPDEEAIPHLEALEGWDIDPQMIHICREKLNTLLPNPEWQVTWNLEHVNALEKRKNEAGKYDYIFGNPPYIRIQNLELEQRKFIQENYLFCRKGSTDIYLAFYELCYDLLSPEGICGLITPNTFLYTETGRNMREFMAAQGSFYKILNLGQKQVFPGATTYSAISIFGKTPQRTLTYQFGLDEDAKTKVIESHTLIGKKAWRISLGAEDRENGVPLGEIANIHVGITTLCDHGFIFPSLEKISDRKVRGFSRILQKEVELENHKQFLRPIFKGSTLPRDPAYHQVEYILYPYQEVEGKLEILPEELLKKQFPLIYAYFCQIRPRLEMRDKGKKQYAAWYAFGRHQSLDKGFGEKIIFSPMNKEPKFIYSENKEATVYSGYFLKLKENPSKPRYLNLLKQLNSDKMKEYIAVSSRDFRGGWKAYNKRVVEDFLIDPERL